MDDKVLLFIIGLYFPLHNISNSNKKKEKLQKASPKQTKLLPSPDKRVVSVWEETIGEISIIKKR